MGKTVSDLVTVEWPLPDLGTHTISFGQCDFSGLILQTETVEEEQMRHYYRSVATYVNPSQGGAPTEAKVRDVARMLEIVKQNHDNFPQKAIQIGSSDGYTLACFREAGAVHVFGVDPGLASVNHARQVYKVDTQQGFIEEIELEEKYDIAILTHVLEHLFDPGIVLEKVASILKDRGLLLIEVPLWERFERQPAGVLAFEHLNYFCEPTLIYLVNQMGFNVHHVSKNYYNNHYPVMTILAEKTGGKVVFDSEFVPHKNKELLLNIVERDRKMWKHHFAIVSRKINRETPLYIYGGGIHTSQLLANTSLSSDFKLEAILDSSPVKWEKKMGAWTIHGPDMLKVIKSGTNILISSLGAELEILKFILEKRSDLNLITIYNQDIK